MITGGIDIGMHSVKVCLLDGDSLRGHLTTPCGRNSAKTVADNALNLCLEKAKADRHDIKGILCTGTLRMELPGTDGFVSMPASLAKGCSRISPKIRTAVDMGAVKTVAVRTDRGRLTKSASNDKCAACSGMYLEMVARILGVSIEDMGRLSLESNDPVEVSSTCAVFAESEIVSLINNKKKVEDILRGVFLALARRTYPLLVNVGLEKDVAMVGGVAHNVGVVKALEEQVGFNLVVPPFPDIAGALGAAAISQERI